MKGVVFNAFEEFVADTWSAEVYEDILAGCPLHTSEPFVGPGNYPDADLFSLVTATCNKFGLEPADALRAFGKFLFHALDERFSEFAKAHRRGQDFLKSVHDVIHVEVRKLYKDAETPSFHVVEDSENFLKMTYSSKRKLCFLVEGLIAGVAERYQEEIECQQEECMHQGAEACCFKIRFQPIS